MTEITEEVIKEYSLKKEYLKSMFKQIYKDDLEKKRLTTFLEESNNIDLSAKNIMLLYEKANYEIPGFIQKKIEEVESFQQKIFEEKKEFFQKRIHDLEMSSPKLQKKSILLGKEIDLLGKIISENESYKDSIEIFEKYNIEYNKKNFEKGQLDQLEKVIEIISDLDDQLSKEFLDLKTVSKEYLEPIEKMRDFFYDTTKRVYSYDSSELISSLNILLRKKHLTARPLQFKIHIKHDKGEGASEVKNILFDILIFKLNKIINFLFLDSICFSGIDPRQVTLSIEIINEIAKKNKKQVIIALNKYQIMGADDLTNEKFLSFIKNNLSIELSEDNKLFKFNFKMKS